VNRQPPTAPRRTRARAVLSHFRKDIRNRRAKLVGGICFAVVYALARVAEPWPLKVVFDQVLFDKPAHGFWLRPFTLFGSTPYDLLAAAGVILALAGLVRGVSYYYEDYLLSSAAQEIVYGIRSRLYKHLHRLPLSFHQRQQTGNLLVRLSTDIVLLRDVLIDAVVNLGTGLVLLALMLVGAWVRHFFNLRHSGRTVWAIPATAAVALVALAVVAWLVVEVAA
jgi:ABC-type multidrug transport system fused ATPase/permease subunit